MSGYVPPSKEFYAIRREVLHLGWGFLNTYGLLLWMAYGFDYPTAVREFREFRGRGEQGDEAIWREHVGLLPVDASLWREIIQPYAHNPAGMTPVWYVKQEEALDAALELLGLLEDADVRMPEIDAIQALTAARDEYLAVYEPFKPLWALAKSWGVDVAGSDDGEGDIDEFRAEIVKTGRGRPPGPGRRAYTKDNFHPEEQAAISRFIEREGRDPSADNIAQGMVIGRRLYFYYKKEYQ